MPKTAPGPAAGGSLALRLQLLPTLREKALVTATLVAQRRGDGTFSPAALTAALIDLSIPPPDQLGRDAYENARSGGRNNFSGGRAVPANPEAPAGGRRYVGALDLASLEAEAVLLPGAEFAHVQHTVIPHWAAPPRWQVGIKRLLADHPFETNVFCMTRFPSEGPLADPVNEAIDMVRSSLKGFGLTVHVASDRLIEDDLLGNVGAYMWGCQYGVGVVEDRVKRGLNYNAVIEVGGMIVTGRRCAILKDVGTPILPTDLSGQIYKSVDLDDPETIHLATETWASQDLGLSRSG